jgi:flagellar motor switch protein FliM
MTNDERKMVDRPQVERHATSAPLTTTAASRWRDKLTRFDARHAPSGEDDPLRKWRTIHEAFVGDFAVALGELVRWKVEVRVADVERLGYGEFVGRLTSPTCFQVLKAAPLVGHAVVEINPSIVFPIIDRLLGGGKDFSPPARRPLTEIELRLTRRVTDVFLHALRRAWSDVLPLEFAVARVESNPRLAIVLPRDEPVVLTRFELTIAGAVGSINLAFPASTLEHFGGTGVPESSLAQNAAPVGGAARSTFIEVVARLAPTQISREELIGLDVGDLIATEMHFESPLVVEVDGVVRFHARPGACQGHKAVRIEDAIQPAKGTP